MLVKGVVKMIRVRQIKIPVTAKKEELFRPLIAQKLHISEDKIINYHLNKEAIDARDKQNIYYVYELDVEVKDEEKILKKNKSNDVLIAPWEKYVLPEAGTQKIKGQIVVVGTGPAGLFAAYLLADAGYKPLVIERGKMVDERLKDVETFWQEGKLNPESNVQFGEGGAGTFSDGKLNTLVKDKRHLGKKVKEIFIENGAPREISYIYNPHIGTDKLRKVVKNMREKIIAMGGSFLFNTKLTNIIRENNALKAIEVNNKEIIPCQNLILAIGHSARDTFKMLLEHDLKMEAKPFAVGIRIMHDQKLINENQYGKFARLLPNASYKLTYTTKDKRGVYSFCMCPGGYVVNASSENQRLAINGMSDYNRDSGVANSAIVVTVAPIDYGKNILDGMHYQEQMESLAYNLASGKIPVQRWQDFQNNLVSTNLNFEGKFKGLYEPSNIREVLPTYIINSLLEAIPYFGKKIKGYDNPDALLAIIESRTSSPLRIIRDPNMESSIKGIYPCGEGAGYAGGITTSAIDGLKCAEEIIKKYLKP